MTADTGTPVLFLHCRQVYDAMMQRAFKTGGREGPDGYEPEMVVYEGKLSQLITRDLNLSVPYYTHTMRELKRMGCVRQLRRGGGHAASQWELVREPTEELWYSEGGPARPSGNDKSGMLEQQIRGLTARVASMEEAYRTLASNYAALERKVR